MEDTVLSLVGSFVVNLKGKCDVVGTLERLGFRRHPSCCCDFNEIKTVYINRGFYNSFPIGYAEEFERSAVCNGFDAFVLKFEKRLEEIEKKWKEMKV